MNTKFTTWQKKRIIMTRGCLSYTFFLLFFERRINDSRNQLLKNICFIIGGSDTYSVSDIAIILGISKKSAYKLCEQNFFISKRIGRIIRVNKNPLRTG